MPFFLACACFLCMSSWFSVAAVLPELTVAWRMSTEEAPLLSMAVQLGFVAGAVVSAFLTLADVVGPRRLILVGALAAAAANAFLIYAISCPAALPLRFAVGASLALVYPPFLKVMATWFTKGRGAAFGLLLGGLTLGSAVPHLFRAFGGADWHAVILGTSALTAAGGVLAWALGREGPYPFRRAVFAPGQVLRVVADRDLRLAACGYFGHMWELYAMWTYFPLCAMEVLMGAGWTRAQSSLVSFGVIASGSLGCLLGGRLGDRWGRTRATSLALALSGLACLVVGIPGMPVPLFLALGLLWGFWVNADSAQFTCITSEIADQEYVGTAMTVQLAAGFLLTNVTLFLTPLVRSAAGFGVAFPVLALGPLLGILAMTALRRSPAAARIAGGLG